MADISANNLLLRVSKGDLRYPPTGSTGNIKHIMNGRESNIGRKQASHTFRCEYIQFHEPRHFHATLLIDNIAILFRLKRLHTVWLLPQQNKNSYNNAIQ